MELTDATRQLIEYFNPPQPPLKRGESSLVSPVSQFDPNPSQSSLKRGESSPNDFPQSSLQREEYATDFPPSQGGIKGGLEQDSSLSPEEIKRRAKLIQFLQNPSSFPRIVSPYTLPQSPLYNLNHQDNHPLNKRGYEGQLNSYRYPLNKYIHKESHPEGWGFIHHQIGKAQYKHKEYHNAFTSYHQALETLTVDQFPKLRLEVIQDMIIVCLCLSDRHQAEDYQTEGLDILNQLLNDVPINDEAKRLDIEKRYAIFRQLNVNLLLQKGLIIEALRNAELEKNRRLTHILERYKPENQIIYPTYETIQTLLTPNNAIIYWYDSPLGIITFILKQGLKAPLFNANWGESTTEKAPLFKGGLGGSNPILNEEGEELTLQDWIKQWDSDYQDYRSKKTQNNDNKQQHSWRTSISDRLQTLRQLLDIPTLETHLIDVEELIFVPHRDLHRFPLHYLFTAKDWTISYTPSLQIALNLRNEVGSCYEENEVQLEGRLLSIENPVNDLPFAEIESNIVNTYFANVTPSITTIEDFKNAIPNHTHVHYTGHGYYNFTHPERSALTFANHTPLTAYEISHLNFTSYQLITLAACETALSGNQLIESEYVGLVSAFLKSGANCVISTLWTVNEISSAWLMIYFYQQYCNGIPPKLALKNAQYWLKNVTHAELIDWLTSLKQKIQPTRRSVSDRIQREIENIQENPDKIGLGTNYPYDHPYYWSGFTVNGNHH